MKIPLAIAVKRPRPSTARLKIAPHITEVQRPTRRKANVPSGICCQTTFNSPQSTPGKLTVLALGANIPKSTSRRVAIVTVVTIVRLLTLLPILAPTKRPTSIIAQYTATNIPTILEGICKPVTVPFSVSEVRRLLLSESVRRFSISANFFVTEIESSALPVCIKLSTFIFIETYRRAVCFTSVFFFSKSFRIITFCALVASLSEDKYCCTKLGTPTSIPI